MRAFISLLLSASLVKIAVARKRLEPTEGIILHGGGSGDGDFDLYIAYMNGTSPSVFMTYLGLDSLNQTAEGQVAKWFSDLNSTLASYGNASDWYVIPQLGLSLPHHGQEKEIGEGKLDPALRALVTGLRWLARPVFMRIGYEFNGPWNAYHSDSYKAAYKRIVQFIRADNVTAALVANIWDRTCDDTNDDKPFYPGDDIVDWWGINIYSDHSQPGNKDCVQPFLDRAKDAGFPVALGEVTPRGKYTDKGSTWDEWFAPYFDMLKANPHIKLTSYINRNWEKHGGYKGWGDSLIGDGVSDGLAAKYYSAMSEEQWINKVNQTTMWSVLGLA